MINGWVKTKGAICFFEPYLGINAKTLMASHIFIFWCQTQMFSVYSKMKMKGKRNWTDCSNTNKSVLSAVRAVSHCWQHLFSQQVSKEEEMTSGHTHVSCSSELRLCLSTLLSKLAFRNGLLQSAGFNLVSVPRTASDCFPGPFVCFCNSCWSASLTVCSVLAWQFLPLWVQFKWI